MGAYSPGQNGMILERLEAAVHAGNITAIVPEDLEIAAHNTLWSETKPTELTLLKALPTIAATSVRHEYTKVISYGVDKGYGFFGERAMAEEVNFETERVQEYIKLLGLVGPTFLLAHLEKTQKVLGANSAQGAQRVSLRRNLLKRNERALFFSDTRTTRSDLRFRGLVQQIEEGTDGTTGDVSPYGTHIIDMQGQPLAVDTLRRKIGETITLFGFTSALFMDPLVRSDFESSLDSAQRLNLPSGMAPFRVGQHISGLQTQGGVAYFETNNTLSPLHSRGPYSPKLQKGAPPNKPTVVITAQADGDSDYDSLWDASSAGDVFYVITEVVDDREGLGRKTALTTVNAGQEVKLVITPTSTEVESFRIYRGHEDTGTDDTDAWFIFEVAAAADGSAVTVYDDNRFRPRTSMVFGLNIVSDSFDAMTAPNENAYYNAREKSADFLSQSDRETNTVAVATLGPKYGIMALASVLAEVDRPLMYSAQTLEVRNPYQNFVLINVGYRS